MTRPHPPIRYLSRPEVATRINVQRATIARYRLPAPDAFVGRLPGWLPGTIDKWDAARPSRRKTEETS